MIVLDSDVLIDLARRVPRVQDAIDRLDAAGEELATTSVNAAEFLRGVHRDPESLGRATTILRGLVEIPLGPRSARRYGLLMYDLDRRGTPMPALDGLVAAIVLESGARLLTRNRRHFERVGAIEVLTP